MWIIKSNNKFISYLIVLFSLFILLLVTYNQYEVLQINLDTKSNLENELAEKKVEVNKYNEIEAELKKDTNITSKYLIEFNEDKLVKYIFDYVENFNNDENKIFITDISLTEWVSNDLWFTESNINISANISNYDTMITFLDFFISSPDYKFFIDNFNFPNDWREWSFNVNIPLKIYYN